MAKRQHAALAVAFSRGTFRATHRVEVLTRRGDWVAVLTTDSDEPAHVRRDLLANNASIVTTGREYRVVPL